MSVPLGTCTTWYTVVEMAVKSISGPAGESGAPRARSRRRESSAAREQLLAAVVGYVATHGFSDLSLREVAAAIGTSHRMLIYHFGSREGLAVDLEEEPLARPEAGIGQPAPHGAHDVGRRTRGVGGELGQQSALRRLDGADDGD